MNISGFLRIWLCLVLGSSSWAAAKGRASNALQEGDIVFSGSARGQGEAIIAATLSPYTHCGVVFEKDGELMVLEAVQPVGITTLKAFKSRSRASSFKALRLKTAVKPAAYQKARTWATSQIGRNYDVAFRWDDQKLYCSELVWKIFEKAGVELCELRRFKDYNLNRPAVRKIIEQRYGGMDRLPLNEKVVAPSDLAASSLLAEVPRKK